MIDYSEVFHRLLGIEPLGFKTVAGFGFTTLRYNTRNIHFELINRVDDYLMACSCKRGGMGILTTRYIEANNPLLPDYDSSKKSSELHFLDANSLYPGRMASCKSKMNKNYFTYSILIWLNLF